MCRTLTSAFGRVQGVRHLDNQLRTDCLYWRRYLPAEGALLVRRLAHRRRAPGQPSYEVRAPRPPGARGDRGRPVLVLQPHFVMESGVVGAAETGLSRVG